MPGICTIRSGDSASKVGLPGLPHHYRLWELALKTVVFSNQKGGVGKSTLAVLFAHWLMDKQGMRVAFVDLDAQANSTKTLSRTGVERQAMELFSDEPLALPSLAPWPASERACLLFAGGKALADLELMRPERVIPAFRAQLARLAPCVDWAVIDTPPALGLRMSAALIAADEVVCPIELEEYSIDAVTDMLKTVFGVQRRYNPGLHLAGILANRFNARSARQKSALHELVSRYSEFVVPAVISTRAAIPEALAARRPVWSLPKTSAREASLEIVKAFELLLARMAGADEAVP